MIVGCFLGLRSNEFRTEVKNTHSATDQAITKFFVQKEKKYTNGEIDPVKIRCINTQGS